MCIRDSNIITIYTPCQGILRKNTFQIYLIMIYYETEINEVV